MAGQSSPNVPISHPAKVALARRGLRTCALLLSAIAAPTACLAPFEGDESDSTKSQIGFKDFALKAPDCSDTQIKAITGSGESTVEVKCSFYASKIPDIGDMNITRTLAFAGNEASNVVFDCGNLISIGEKGVVDASSGKSRRGVTIASKITLDSSGKMVKDADGYYDRKRPRNVIIRNCDIYGSVRVSGLGGNAHDAKVWTSSIDTTAPGHTARARDAAPTNILLDRVTIDVIGRPLYLGPGVTDFTLRESTLTGVGHGALYLDAESFGNTFENNIFAVVPETDLDGKPRGREQVSIDGSEGNLFINNSFRYSEFGGIYLYRNCGEAIQHCETVNGKRTCTPGTLNSKDPRFGLPENELGTVRWAQPAHNRIINNYFYPGSTVRSQAKAIWLGQRDGTSDYCHLDSAYDFGSGRYDWDYARYNVVMQNEILQRPPSDVILATHTSINSPNYESRNTQVSSPSSRAAGCFLESRYTKDFIESGKTALQILTRDTGEVCVNQRCENGILTDIGSCSLEQKPLKCDATDNDSGCRAEALCPSGKSVISAKVACNLESGAVTGSQLDRVPPGSVDVVKLSANSSDGLCTVGNTSVVSRRDFIRGTGTGSVVATCRERDVDSGGDCSILGTVYCH